VEILIDQSSGSIILWDLILALDISGVDTGFGGGEEDRDDYFFLGVNINSWWGRLLINEILVMDNRWEISDWGYHYQGKEEV
jgi:hypothetical protein